MRKFRIYRSFDGRNTTIFISFGNDITEARNNNLSFTKKTHLKPIWGYYKELPITEKDINSPEYKFAKS